MTRNVTAALASAMIGEVVNDFGTADSYERQGVPPSQLNLMLIPVNEVVPRDPVTADQARSVYSHYNVSRAEAMLGRLGLRGPGPYLITLKDRIPMDRIPVRPPYLMHDLSGTSPPMARALVEYFAKSAMIVSQGLSPSQLEFFAVKCRVFLDRNDFMPGVRRPVLALMATTR